MGEKGNAAALPAATTSSGPGVVSSAVAYTEGITTDLGDHAAHTVVALGAERAVEGLIEQHNRPDGDEGDDPEPDPGVDQPPASS